MNLTIKEKAVFDQLWGWKVVSSFTKSVFKPPCFIIYDKSSSPSVDDYLIDADYPIETYF